MLSPCGEKVLNDMFRNRRLFITTHAENCVEIKSKHEIPSTGAGLCREFLKLVDKVRCCELLLYPRC